jgi:MarR family transcriptional regulator, organic hydroperoxide resistance regulator
MLARRGYRRLHGHQCIRMTGCARTKGFALGRRYLSVCRRRLYWRFARHQGSRVKKNNRGRPRSGRRRLALAVLGQFRLIYGSVRHQHRRIEESCGISGAQLWILREVERAPVGVSELAVKLSIHQSTCSQLVEKLVRRKMLLKNVVAGDKRRVQLALSKGGERCLKVAPGPAEGILPKALLGVSESSLRALHSHLGKVVARLGKSDERYRNHPLSDL